jgi:hypothetical protein
MSDNGRGLTRTADFTDDANVTKSVVGVAKGRDVHLTRAGAALVAAGRDLSVVNGGCGPALVNGNMTIHNGGCGPVIANGGLSIHNGGCGPVMANGDVSIETGGAQAILAAGRVAIGGKAFVGVVASPSVSVEEGGRVLMSSPMAFAVGVGAGIALTMLSRLVGKSERETSDDADDRAFGWRS